MTEMKLKLSGRLIRMIWNNNRKMSETKECGKMRSKMMMTSEKGERVEQVVGATTEGKRCSHKYY